MKKFRVVCAVLCLAVLIVAGVFGMQTPAFRYARAESKLASGKYEQAGETFEDLRWYRDASVYSLYCKSMLAKEKGDYSAAAIGFDYLQSCEVESVRKDAGVQYAYCQALVLEQEEQYEQATGYLNDVLFYGDSAERLMGYPEKINQRDYAIAEKLEAEGEYLKAAAAFKALGSYYDSASRWQHALELQKEAEENAAAIAAEKLEAEMREAYAAAEKLEAEGKYREAVSAFLQLGDYKDSPARYKQVLALAKEAENREAYAAAEKLEAEGKYTEAAAAFQKLGDYSDSQARMKQALATAEEIENKAAYAAAEKLEDEGKYTEAAEAFRKLGTYSDSAARSQHAMELYREQQNANAYAKAEKLYDDGKLQEAAEAFDALGDYRDSRQIYADIIEEIHSGIYAAAEEAEAAEDYVLACALYTSLENYRDSAERANALLKPANYQLGMKALAEYRYEDAFRDFYAAGDWQDAAQKCYAAGAYFYADDIQGLSSELAVYSFLNEWGFVNFRENELIHPTWASIELIGSDVFAVSKNGKYGLVDTSANQVFDCTWDSWKKISDNVLLIQENGKYGTVSLDGTVLEAPVWTAYQLEPAAILCSVDDLHGMASLTTGLVTLPIEYKAVQAISSRLYRIANDTGIGLADCSGAVLSDCVWSDLSKTIVDGCLVAAKQEGVHTYYGLLGIDGTVIAEPIYQTLGDEENGSDLKAVFSDGWMRCRTESGWGYLASDGRVIEPIYQDAKSFVNHMAAVRVGDYWGFLNESGELAIEAKYAAVWPFNENGVAKALMQNGQYFILTASGDFSYFADTRYTRARALEAEGKLEEALELYDALGNYDDSLARAAAVRYEIILQLTEAGDYAAVEKFIGGADTDGDENAVRAFYTCAVAAETAGDDATAMELFRKCGDYEDALVRYAKILAYSEAVKAEQEERYADAVRLYGKLTGYRDCDSRVEKLKEEYVYAEIMATNVGDYITFGSYEQDNDLTNGSEPIEWQVLEKEGSRMMLISRYGLDVKQYNAKNTNVTWANSSIRLWLSRTFINKAFTAEEGKMILKTQVENGKQQGNGAQTSKNGNTTEDKVFLLSSAEIEKYFPVFASRTASPTAYARAQGAGVSLKAGPDGNAMGYWWLRSLDSSQNHAEYVYGGGAINRAHVNSDNICVRPVLWVDLGGENASVNVGSSSKLSSEEAQLARLCYFAAEAAEQAGDDAFAAELFRKCGDYMDATKRAERLQTYVEAIQAEQEERYGDAIKLYAKLGEFRDCISRVEKLREEYVSGEMMASEVGEYITFGSYEQDNDLTNGSEPIEWLVLEKKGSKLFLVSRYGLDGQPAHSKNSGFSWEKATLRTWLNETFLNQAFSADEQQMILTTEVDNSAQQGLSKWQKNDDNNTLDRIFLLSCAEAKRYFNASSGSVSSRISPTLYARERGVGVSIKKTTEEADACWWWLRSPTLTSFNSACVTGDGSISSSGITTKSVAVRPAMWIDLG